MSETKNEPNRNAYIPVAGILALCQPCSRVEGVATIRDQLAGTDARIREFAHGVCIQACPTPEIGDTSRNDYVDAYHPIAMLVRPVRIDAVSGGSLPSDFRAHNVQDWLDAFDRDQKEQS